MNVVAVIFGMPGHQPVQVVGWYLLRRNKFGRNGIARGDALVRRADLARFGRAAFLERSGVGPDQFGVRGMFSDGRQKFREGLAIFVLAMLPAMHAVVKLDDVKRHAIEHQRDFFQKHGVGQKCGGRQPRHRSLARKPIGHFGIIAPGDRIADEQDSGQSGLIRLCDPDVAPFRRFTSGRRHFGRLRRGKGSETVGQQGQSELG